MITGKIIGQIYSTINHPFYDQKKLMIVEKTDPVSGKASKGYVIAIDAVDAGVGQNVLILEEGNGARQIVDDKSAPVRSVVVGIVDEVRVETA